MSFPAQMQLLRYRTVPLPPVLPPVRFHHPAVPRCPHHPYQSAVYRCLDERERKVVILRYGLSNEEPLTQRETAKKCGISRSYVSRIEKRALEKLRAALGEEAAPD